MFTSLLMATVTVFLLSHLNWIYELRISGSRFISTEQNDTEALHLDTGGYGTFHVTTHVINASVVCVYVFVWESGSMRLALLFAN